MPQPFIPVPHTVQVNVRFLVANQQCENVLNFDYGTADFASACAQINSALDATWWTGLRVNISDEVSHIENYYVDLSSETGPTSTFGPFSSPTGGASAHPVPNNVAFCITHRTAGRGRGARGRTFVLGLGVNALIGSQISAVGASNIAGYFNSLNSELTTEDILFAVVSRFEGGNRRVTGIAQPIVISIARDVIVDSQRRRLPGRGN